MLTDFGVTYMKVVFKGGPRRVTRVILRTTRNGNEHLRTGEILVHQDADPVPNVVPFEFDTVEQCALQVKRNTPA